MMKSSIASLAWRFSAHRMVMDYTRSAYVPAAGGRSINLAMSARGIRGLKYASVFDRVEPLLVTMAGRCIHELDGSTNLHR